jgi:hypothetical protein
MAIAKYSKTCGKNVPGNSRLFFTEAANIGSITVTSTNEISAITMKNGTPTVKFQEFGADIDSIKFTIEGTGSASYSEVQKLEAKFSKKTTALITAKNSLLDAVACGVAIIRVDNNGSAWLSGYTVKDKNRRAYNKITTNFDTGAKPSDEGTAAYTITLEAEGFDDELPFDTSLNASIISGAATFIDYN